MANRTEIATATAIATAIVEDSFCRIISIDAFCVGGGGGGRLVGASCSQLCVWQIVVLNMTVHVKRHSSFVNLSVLCTLYCKEEFKGATFRIFLCLSGLLFICY